MGSKATIDVIRKNNSRGIIFEGKIQGPPCVGENLIEVFGLKKLCNFTKAISKDPLLLLWMLKYNKQSPIFLEKEDEYQYFS